MRKFNAHIVQPTANE